MPVTLKTRVHAGIFYDWRDEDSAGREVFRDRGDTIVNDQLGSGTMDLQADQIWHGHGSTYRRLAASASETFDLTALVSEVLGYTSTLDPFIEIRAIHVVNRTTAQGAYLLVGGAASNEFHAPFGAAGDKVRVNRQVMLSNTYDGWNVSGTAKNIKVENPSAVDVDYEITILGTTGASTSSSGS